MRRKKLASTALVATLPGETTVDDALVDQVVVDLNRIYAQKGLETARTVGEYLLTTFFGGDPARFHERGKGHASFRRLAERDDLKVSSSFLWHACAVVEQLRQLPEDVGGALPLSHHRLLLSVKDQGDKERLAREAVEQRLSKRDLETAVRDARPEVAPESKPGRKPLSALAKGLTKLKAAVLAAGAEDVAEAVGRMKKDKAKALLAQLDEQVAALGKLRAAVEAAMGGG